MARGIGGGAGLRHIALPVSLPGKGRGAARRYPVSGRQRFEDSGVVVLDLVDPVADPVGAEAHDVARLEQGVQIRFPAGSRPSQRQKSGGSTTTGIRRWIGASAAFAAVVTMVQERTGPVRAVPALPQAGEGERPFVLIRHPVGHVGRTVALPFVEAVCGDQAAPPFPGAAELGFSAMVSARAW